MSIVLCDQMLSYNCHDNICVIDEFQSKIIGPFVTLQLAEAYDVPADAAEKAVL